MALSVVAKFIADEWFKLMAVIAFFFLALSLTVELKVDNLLITFLSAGLMFYGFAEMAFRPFRTRLVQYDFGIGKISGRPKVVNPSGVVLMVIGFAFIAGAIYRMTTLL